MRIGSWADLLRLAPRIIVLGGWAVCPFVTTVSRTSAVLCGWAEHRLRLLPLGVVTVPAAARLDSESQLND